MTYRFWINHVYNSKIKQIVVIVTLVILLTSFCNYLPLSLANAKQSYANEEYTLTVSTLKPKYTFGQWVIINGTGKPSTTFKIEYFSNDGRIKGATYGRIGEDGEYLIVLFKIYSTDPVGIWTIRVTQNESVAETSFEVTATPTPDMDIIPPTISNISTPKVARVFLQDRFILQWLAEPIEITVKVVDDYSDIIEVYLLYYLIKSEGTKNDNVNEDTPSGAISLEIAFVETMKKVSNDTYFIRWETGANASKIVFWIKAIDSWGNMATSPKYNITLIPVLFELSTSKKVYYVGETVEIKGILKDKLGSPVPNKHIWCEIRFRKPDGEVGGRRCRDIVTDNQGIFIYSFQASDVYVGFWNFTADVYATYTGGGGYLAGLRTNISFTIRPLLPFGKPLTIEVTDTKFQTTKPKPNTGFLVHTKYFNYEDKDYDVIVFVQIKTQNNEVVFLGALKTSVGANSFAEVYLGPEHGLPSGIYVVETYIWNAETLSPLGDVGNITLTIP
jgi:hypothetical protein